MGENRSLDPKTALLMRFFEEEFGAKFFDVDKQKYANSKGEEYDKPD